MQVPTGEIAPRGVSRRDVVRRAAVISTAGGPVAAITD